jgi:hypothetical protein
VQDGACWKVLPAWMPSGGGDRFMALVLDALNEFAAL